MKFKKYLKETTIAGDVANYDKKIGDKGDSKTGFIELIIKKENYMNKLNKLVQKYKLNLTRRGNLVKIEGSVETINQLKKMLSDTGIV